MTKPESNIDKKVHEFLNNHQVVIFDSSASARNLICAVLRELGCPAKNIHGAKKYPLALQIVQKEKPQMIISEYEVHGKYGLELLEEAKKIIEKPIFVLATGTASETAVAEAAEEEVDAYVVKPFLSEKLKEYLRLSIKNYISPPPYIDKINQGKKAIEDKDITEAKKFFFEASTIEEKPSLAMYYLGQLNEIENHDSQALELYQSGLDYVPIHYKCLVAKFEILDKFKRPDEAYKVVQEIQKHYPVTPQRLGRMIYLAMLTKNFKDVEAYYDLYQKLDTRTDKLQVIVKAALFTCGRFLVQSKDIDGAYSLFEKSIMCSKRDPQVIAKAVEEFLLHDQVEKAKAVLELFSQDDLPLPITQQTQFKVDAKLLDSKDVVKLGSKIIDGNAADLFVYETVIHLLKMEGSDRIAEKYAHSGVSKFPELKKYLA